MLFSRKQVPAVAGNGVDVGVLDGLVGERVDIAVRFAGQEVTGKGRTGEWKVLVELE